MRRLWATGALTADQAEAAANCLSTVMLQPAISAQMLEELAVGSLGLEYRRQSLPSAEAAG